MVKQKQRNTTILTRQDYKNSLVTIIEVFQNKRKKRICKEYSPWNWYQIGKKACYIPKVDKLNVEIGYL